MMHKYNKKKMKQKLKFVCQKILIYNIKTYYKESNNKIKDINKLNKI